MTESRRGPSMVDTHRRPLTMLAALAVGVLFCACSSNSVTTGVLKGTATPCIGLATYSSSHAWKITVTLRRGSTVVSTRRVFDTQAAGDPVTDQIFSFTEPGGHLFDIGTYPPRATSRDHSGDDLDS